VRVMHELGTASEIVEFEAWKLLDLEELGNLCFPDGQVASAYYILERCLVHYSIYRIIQSLPCFSKDNNLKPIHRLPTALKPIPSRITLLIMLGLN
jgi:hypothetical protein